MGVDADEGQEAVADTSGEEVEGEAVEGFVGFVLMVSRKHLEHMFMVD